jgi:hypothetical protein
MQQNVGKVEVGSLVKGLVQTRDDNTLKLLNKGEGKVERSYR